MHMPAKSDPKLKKWEFPRKSGIWIREFLYSQTLGGKPRTYSAFQVTIPAKMTGSVRKRKQCNTREEAEKFASAENLGSKKQGEEYFKATDEERKEFSFCLPKLRDKGISLTEAVDFALERLKPNGGERSIGEVASELIESKRLRFERGDLRERSFRDFRHRAGKFAEAFPNTQSHSLTMDQVKDWLIGLKVTPRTTQNYLSIVSEILKYAVQKKYIAVSPAAELTDSDRKELCGSNLE